ncbi:MAG: SNF2-related protein [Cytophagales bacterium]|nr:SNF2-related protein [Cytophagales bacterium]
MAKRQTFGKTWWGEQWLRALEGIDFSNRLPRGKTYANKGAVQKLSFKKNEIKASVAGSYQSSYRISIEVPEFTLQEKIKLVELAVGNDLILTELLNSQLPGDLLHLLETHGIHLFPKNWKSFGMHCSCPDFAVPCKHLAAVIYKISEEIDRNPFLILKMKGLDLLEELKKQGLDLTEETAETILQTSDCLLESPHIPSPDDKPLDLSLVPNVSERLLHLLSDKPLFFGKDFKTLLKKAYNSTAKLAKSWADEEQLKENFSKKLKSLDDLSLVIDSDWEFVGLFGTAHGDYELLIKEASGLPALAHHLLLLDRAERHLHHPSVWHFRRIARFAYKLAQEKAYMPRLVESGNGHSAQWIPAVLDEKVQALFSQLSDSLPNDLLTVQTPEGLKHFSPQEQLHLLCHIFLNIWIPEACFALKGSQLPKTDAKVFELFFEEKFTRFDSEWDETIPQAVQLWLRKLYIAQKDTTPVLIIEEGKRDCFEVSMEIKTAETSYPIAEYLRHPDFRKKKFEVLKDINLLAEHFRDLNKLLTLEEDKLVYQDYEFEPILFDMLPTLQLLGIGVVLPKTLRKLIAPNLSMSIKKNENETGKSHLSLADMLDFEWTVALGDVHISEREFRKLVQSNKKLVKFQNQYVHLNAEEINAILRKLEKPPKAGANEVLQAALSEKYEGTLVHLTDEVRSLIQEFTKTYDVESPEGLLATLRPYQQSGYSWLYKNARLGLGSLLADDMGLGKTLQTIAVLSKFKEDGLLQKKKALAVVPTSLLTNWKKEIEKFAPSLDAQIYHGTKRKMPENFDLLLTTYGLLRTDLSIFKKMKWYCLVIDEAQNIKNVLTGQTKAVKSVKADVKIALSGTPVENRLSEYWSVMDFANKGYLGSLKKFTDKIAKPIQNDQSQAALDQFKRITAPFIMRRLKSDKSIISDLPEKIEHDLFCHLSKEQTGLYQNIINQSLETIQKEEDSFNRKGLVLKMLTALKQICNHPAQFAKKGDTSPDLSGKAQQLLAILDTAHEAGEKTLIFTQYKEAGDLLKRWAEERYGHEALFLHGGTSRKQRDQMVECFQENPMCKVFILSIKAGGTGLNLTKASHVVHYDLWWNPAVEHQDNDKDNRIGQQNNVMVHRLICEGTFEEKIDEMIKSKRQLADLTVAQGEKWIGDLNDRELGELVELTAEE